MDSLTRRLARLVRERPVTGEDRERAERYVRDWVGSLVAGGAAPTGRVLRAYSGDAADLESRAFLTAALSHVTETDDLHRGSVTHPACVVMPAALLLGHRLKRRGHAVLDAVVRGYEVMIRAGEALGPAHYRLFHNTATAGVFGSAAAAADLLELDEDGWVWALGNAGTQAAGLWQFNEEGTMTKPLHAGHAATAGMRAAGLAAQGFTGPEEILEGSRGLFAALCPDASPDAVLADSPEWKLPGTSMKPYPCCRHVHPAVDAALELRGGLDGRRPVRICIGSYPAALDRTDCPRPETPEEARFSIQYAVVTALTRGRPGLEAFQDEAVTAASVRDLLEDVEVGVDEGFAEAYPGRWGASVRVETEDGWEGEVRRMEARGDPEHPLDDDELDEKVLGLFGWAGREGAWGQEALGDIRALVADGPVPAWIAGVGGQRG